MVEEDKGSLIFIHPLRRNYSNSLSRGVLYWKPEAELFPSSNWVCTVITLPYPVWPEKSFKVRSSFFRKSKRWRQWPEEEEGDQLLLELLLVALQTRRGYSSFRRARTMAAYQEYIRTMETGNENVQHFTMKPFRIVNAHPPPHSCQKLAAVVVKTCQHSPALCCVVNRCNQRTNCCSAIF